MQRMTERRVGQLASLVLLVFVVACGSSSTGITQSQPDATDTEFNLPDIPTPTADQRVDPDLDPSQVEVTLPPSTVIAGTPISVGDLQDLSSPKHPQQHSTVVLKGLIATTRAVGVTGDFTGLFAQDPAGGTNSGILLVFLKNDLNSQIGRGSRLDLEGEYLEWYGMSQILVKKLVVLGKASQPIAPLEVDVALLQDKKSAEPYEGMLVKVINVKVATSTDSHGEFRLEGGLLVDDLFIRFKARPGQSFDSLVGIVNYSFKEFKLEPRDKQDFGTCQGIGCDADAFEIPRTLDSACGEIGYEGRCENNSVVWCEDGVLKKNNCSSHQATCGWDDHDKYFICIPAGEACGNVTYEGQCDGQMLRYCEFGIQRSVDCGAANKNCGVNKQGLHDCVTP